MIPLDGQSPNLSLCFALRPLTTDSCVVRRTARNFKMTDRKTSSVRIAFLFIALFLAGRQQLWSADRVKPEGLNRPVVDQISLKSGVRLRGMLSDRSETSTTMLVSAQWLKAANKTLFESARAKTISEHSAALRQVVESLEAVIGLGDQQMIKDFLKQQLSAAQKELAVVGSFEPDFLWFILPSRDVQRTDAIPVEHRQLLAWAWSERLERAETRTGQDLLRELKDRAVSPLSWPMSLIERLPAREQASDEWSARLAVVEHTFGASPHFQGTAGVLVRAEPGAQADIATLLGQLLQQQVKSQLGDLLGEPRPANAKLPRDTTKFDDALKPVFQAVEREQQRGFRVTRLELSADLQSSTITTQFFARLPNGTWQSIFNHSEQANAQQTRPEIERRIQNDPQVKQVLEVARQLGLSAEEQIQQAIRFGAATLSAQQAVDQQFSSFRDRSLSSLARPMWLVRSSL